MWFWIAQIFGGVALILLCFSFQQNNKKILLKYQILSSLFYALQYLFLNAFSGCFMNVACVFRNFIFRRYESRRPPVYYLLIVVGVMLFLSYFSYQGWISLLPVIAVISCRRRCPQPKCLKISQEILERFLNKSLFKRLLKQYNNCYELIVSMRLSEATSFKKISFQSSDVV